jgi:amino acid permease
MIKFFRKMKTKKKIIIAIILIVILFLIWAELGVGIFGTPFAGD